MVANARLELNRPTESPITGPRITTRLVEVTIEAMLLLVFSIFALAGIGLCITKHPWWGALCFVIAILVLLAMV